MSSIFDLFKKIEKPAEIKPIERMIVFLGNPGKEYESTRHNAGFLFCAYLHDSKDEQVVFTTPRSRFHALTAETTIDGVRVLALSPMTYMNESGIAVREALDFYKLPPEKMIVVCDDVQFDIGKIRIRRKGSDGGQRGLRSIIYHLQTEDFPRIRVGVGKKPEGYDLRDWVLSRFTDDEMKALHAAFPNVSAALRLILKDDFDTAMSKYN